jgi:hypothetical protein
MDTMMRHTAGNGVSLQYRLSLNLVRAGLDELRSDLLSRFIEFWCQKNCIGDWRIEETSRSLTVWFDLARDVVLFKISDEYDYFSDHTSPVVFNHIPPFMAAEFTLNILCAGTR